MLGEGMPSGLTTFEPAHQQAPLLPMDIAPAQIAKLAHAQPVVERDPDRRSVTRALPVLRPGSFAQRQHLIAGKMLARSALRIGHANRASPLCPIINVWRGAGHQAEKRPIAGAPLSVCPITKHFRDGHGLLPLTLPPSRAARNSADGT